MQFVLLPWQLQTLTLIDTDTYRHLKAKPGEHTGILLLTLEKLNHGKRV